MKLPKYLQKKVIPEGFLKVTSGVWQKNNFVIIFQILPVVVGSLR